jgi:hypothetical protein
VSPMRHHLSLYDLLFFDHIGQDEVCSFLRELLQHLRAGSLFCWTIPPLTKGNHSRNSSSNIPDSPSSIFPPTPRTSIPMKESDHLPNGNSPTAVRMISRS